MEELTLVEKSFLQVLWPKIFTKKFFEMVKAILLPNKWCQGKGKMRSYWLIL